MSGGLALPELGLLAASWGVLVAGMTLRVVRAGNGWREAAGWGASGCLRRGRVLWAEILGFVAAVAAGGGLPVGRRRWLLRLPFRVAGEQEFCQVVDRPAEDGLSPSGPQPQQGGYERWRKQHRANPHNR